MFSNPVHLRYSLLFLVVLLSACGGGGSGDAPSAGAGGVTNPVDVTVVPGASSPQDAPSTPLSKFKFESVQPVSGIANTACSGGINNSAQVAAVRLGQTHLMDPAHPFFHLNADREAVIYVSVTGSGDAPPVSVQGRIGAQDLGSFCLRGPSALSATVDTQQLDADSHFVGAVPANWLKPGLALSIQAGGSALTLLPSELKIGPAPALSLVTMDWLLWGDTQPTPVPTGMRAELASRLPLSHVNFSDFPIKPLISTLPINVRGDGRSPSGVEQITPAVLATSPPRCGAAEKTAGTCKAWSGFGALAAILSLTERVQVANGMDGLSHWYGATSKNRHIGGGLGGGVTGSGDDYDLVFNHELGHAFDLPHLGNPLYSRVSATATFAHPYTGQYGTVAQPTGGGFGNSWALDGRSGALISPVCPATGKERQEPMQRSGGACVPSGGIFDVFSDFSALAIHRYFVGSSTPMSGTVSSPRDMLGNTQPRYALPSKTGRPNTTWATDGSATIHKWDTTSQSYTQVTPSTLSSDSRTFGERYPIRWNVPVITLWGSFSNATPEVNLVLPPMEYQGHLKRVWDPTHPSDFAAMKAFISGDAFWWGADLVAKAEFSDGSVRHALVKSSARGTDPLDGSSFTYWAVNIEKPANARLSKVSLYHRPMDVRHGDGGRTNSSYYTPTNLNSSLNKDLTAASYMNTARLVASWQP